MTLSSLPRWLRLTVSLTGTAVIASCLALWAADFFATEKAKVNSLARRMRTRMVLENMGTIAIGDTLPDQTFVNSEGSEVRLSDLLHDRTVLIFTDPGCGSCIYELEQIKAAMIDSADYRYFVLIAPVSTEMLVDFGQELGLPCSMLSDPNGEYTYGLGIHSSPFNLIVDRSLVIVDAVATGMAAADFRKIIVHNNSEKK